MEDFKNKYGTLNPMRINEYIQLKAELLNEYSKVETLESFKEFLTKNKEVTKEIIKEQSIPMNKEIIDYAFVQDNCYYNNKIIKDIIKYANHNGDVELLNVVKERHPDHLRNKANELIHADINTVKFYQESDLLDLTDFNKSYIGKPLIENGEFEKLELFPGCKEYMLNNSQLLNVEGTKNLINHYHLGNEDIKKLFLSSLDKKGIGEEVLINVFNNTPTEEEIEDGAFGEHLLTDKVKYFTENYQFDKKTLQEAFELSVKNKNLETAKYLLENNDFQPKISTMIEIENKYPNFSEYCKKDKLRKDFEVKYKVKNHNRSHDDSLKI